MHYRKGTIVEIKGNRWVVAEHKQGEAALWAYREGTDGKFQVCHRAADAKLVKHREKANVTRSNHQS